MKYERDMKEFDLLPCPFCGEQDHEFNEPVYGAHEGEYWVKCPVCQIKLADDRRDKAIGLWNHRPLMELVT